MNTLTGMAIRKKFCEKDFNFQQHKTIPTPHQKKIAS